MADKDTSASRPAVKTNLLGQLLLKNNLVTLRQLEQALNIQKDKGGMLGDILLEMGVISQESLGMALATQTEAVYIPLEKYKIPREILNLIPKETAFKYLCVPLEKIGSVLAVAMVNPLDKGAIADIEALTRYKLICMIATKAQIENILKANYA